MSRICLYYVPEPAQDRWLPGDRLLRPIVRRLIRGRPRASGIDKVFLNLKLGLDRIGARYHVNLPFGKLRPGDQVGVIGRGRQCLAGYDRPNPIVAGVALMTHPSEWPTLLAEYPVTRYLQHSEWAAEVYRPYFNGAVALWPVGVDTAAWSPAPPGAKSIDVLVYDKIRWDRERLVPGLLEPALAELRRRGLSYEVIRYGAYTPEQYRDALVRARSMVFLVEHESQGLACCEAMSSGVPVLAWDPGECLDPNRFAWGQPYIPATSVPFFDDRCGLRFRDAGEFRDRLGPFLEGVRAGGFVPRDYVLENLTLERCSTQYLRILREAADTPAPAR